MILSLSRKGSRKSIIKQALKVISEQLNNFPALKENRNVYYLFLTMV